MEYRFVSHTEVSDREVQLAELSNIAFAEYEGAPQVDDEFTRWHGLRPGSHPELCMAALDGDEMVSTVLVAIQELNIGGEFISCGIIDTVATHPDHRGRGLARRLMDMAHEVMQDHGAQAAVLYTNPEDHPYRFYGRLGYMTRANARMFAGKRPRATGAAYTVRPAEPADYELIRLLVNDCYENYEGFAMLDDALWDWHRQQRPACLPQSLLVAQRDGMILGFAACCDMDLLIAGEMQPVTVVSDVVFTYQDCLEALLAAAPQADLITLHDERSREAAAFTALGFTPGVAEVAMSLPFTEQAGHLLRSNPAPWYVMVESVVGV